MKNKDKFLDICFSSATLLILLILITNLITVLGWVVKIPMTSFHLPLSIIVTIILNYFLQTKYRGLSKKNYCISIFIFIIVFVVSLLIANMFLDISYDGAWYHSIAILKISEGWNPIYELINSGEFGDEFINSYACKGIWSFGASVYSFIGNINSTKIISSLVAFSVIFLSISIFGKLCKNKWQLILIIFLSIFIGFNPIYIEQLWTNYIDSTLGLYTIFYVLLFISFYLKQTDFTDKIFNILIISCIAIMTNTKLTGLYLAATFFGFYVLLKIFNDIKNKSFNFKWFKKMFWTGFIGVTIAFVIGINPFVTNVVRGHHILYPIFGSEKIEVMGENIPIAFRGKTNLEKLILANFSSTSNSIELVNNKFENPLDLDLINEYSNLSYDTRVCSFGTIFTLVLYILILSLIIFARKIIKGKSNKLLKGTFFLSCLFILLNAMIFSESWWGRYYVIIWIIPLLIAIYFVIEKDKILNIIALLIIVLTFINVGCTTIAMYNKSLNAREISDYISSLEGKKIEFWCYDSTGKWDYFYLKYFEENDVLATPVENEIEDYDFQGVNIQIKIIEED